MGAAGVARVASAMVAAAETARAFVGTEVAVGNPRWWKAEEVAKAWVRAVGAAAAEAATVAPGRPLTGQGKDSSKCMQRMGWTPSFRCS